MCVCMNIYVYTNILLKEWHLTYVGITYCIFIILEKHFFRKQNDYEFIYLANKNILLKV